MKRATIKDVARHANVSIATVSRVINNEGTVAEENREKVQASIDELKYYLNKTAANLKKNASNVIGIVIPDMTNDFFMKLIMGIEDGLEQSNYVFYVASTRDNPKKEEDILRKLLESNVEAIILLTAGVDKSFVYELHEMESKVIVVDRRVSEPEFFPYVGENNYEMAYELVKEFMKQTSYKQFALVGGYEDLSIGKDRSGAAIRALKEEQVEYQYYDGGYSEKSAHRLFYELKKIYPKGCGIISLNNTMTDGFLRGIYEENNGENSGENTRLYPIASYGQVQFHTIFNENVLVAIKQFPYQLGIETAKLIQGYNEKQQPPPVRVVNSIIVKKGEKQ